MATKRQKKLEQKRKKRNEKRRELHAQRSLSLHVQMRQAAEAPVHECMMTSELIEEGIGQVTFSRRLADGHIATACFLVDADCLGVKDAYGRLMTRNEFVEFKQAIAESTEQLVTIDAPSARRLIEQAVTYAADHGLSPSREYRKVEPIFGDVDPEAGRDLCEFGRDGMPHFMAGPHDSPDRCRRIVRTLAKTCGPGGFHFVVPSHRQNLLDELDFVDEDGESLQLIEQEDE